VPRVPAPPIRCRLRGEGWTELGLSSETPTHSQAPQKISRQTRATLPSSGVSAHPRWGHNDIDKGRPFTPRTFGPYAWKELQKPGSAWWRARFAITNDGGGAGPLAGWPPRRQLSCGSCEGSSAAQGTGRCAAVRFEDCSLGRVDYPITFQAASVIYRGVLEVGSQRAAGAPLVHCRLSRLHLRLSRLDALPTVAESTGPFRPLSAQPSPTARRWEPTAGWSRGPCGQADHPDPMPNSATSFSATQATRSAGSPAPEVAMGPPDAAAGPVLNRRRA